MAEQERSGLERRIVKPLLSVFALGGVMLDRRQRSYVDISIRGGWLFITEGDRRSGGRRYLEWSLSDG